MADNYDDYSKDQLVRLLRERDRRPRFGLVWERDEIDHRVETSARERAIRRRNHDSGRAGELRHLGMRAPCTVRGLAPLGGGGDALSSP